MFYSFGWSIQACRASKDKLLDKFMQQVREGSDHRCHDFCLTMKVLFPQQEKARAQMFLCLLCSLYESPLICWNEPPTLKVLAGSLALTAKLPQSPIPSHLP